MIRSGFGSGVGSMIKSGIRSGIRPMKTLMKRMDKNLVEALTGVSAGIERAQIGIWLDPGGNTHKFRGMVHDEWARKHQDASAAELLWKGWGRARLYDNDMMLETRNSKHIWDAIELADQLNKTGIIFTFNKGRDLNEPPIYLDKKDGKWVDHFGRDLDDVLVRLESRETT